MITFPINRKTENSTPFRVMGYQVIGTKKIDTKFVCYANDENNAKEILNEYKLTNLVKYNLRTLAEIKI
jgi:hypothetical protein